MGLPNCSLSLCILGGHFQDPLGAAQHLSAFTDGPLLEHLFQDNPTLVQRPQEMIPWNRYLLEIHFKLLVTG